MPYYIAVYDIDVSRGVKVLKLFRRYLKWVQNSVFEGELTIMQAAELEQQAESLIDGNDSIIIYEWRTEAYTRRRVLGAERGETGTII